MQVGNELIQIFTEESAEQIESLDQQILLLEQETTNREILNEIFRAFHSLKGNAGLVGFSNFEKEAHQVEEVLIKIRDEDAKVDSGLISFMLASLDKLKILYEVIIKTGTDVVNVASDLDVVSIEDASEPSPENDKLDGEIAASSPVLEPVVENEEPLLETSDLSNALDNAPEGQPPDENSVNLKSWGQGGSAIRVDLGLLDSIMDLVGELVLSRNQIVQYAGTEGNDALNGIMQRFNQVTSELQERVMKTRMQPIGKVFQRFPRIVRDICMTTGKKANLTLEGESTELDRKIIESISDPLTHLIRNAVDHGVETSEEREAAGKDPSCDLYLRAYHEGGQVTIEIADEGRGIDTEKIRKKAMERGLVTPEQAADLQEKEVLNFIFKPGFSTAEKVTTISGRGVGMDVVKTNIEKIGGSVELSSQYGKGTSVRIKIPLTLAIVPALIVTAAGQTFSIPQNNLLELVCLDTESGKKIESIGQVEVFRLRDKLLPIVHLSKILGIPAGENKDPGSANIVVLSADGIQFGLVVDEIHDTEEIVIKPLGSYLSEIEVFAGATVLGDGKVGLILDVNGMAKAGQINRIKSSKTKKHDTDTEYSEMRTYLLFSGRSEERFAVPLQMVDRLETFPNSAIEISGDLEVIHYRDTTLPLIRMESHLPDNGPPAGGDSVSILTFSINEYKIGFVVNEIIDVVESDSPVESQAHQALGISGTIILDNRVTTVIDVFKLIYQRFPQIFICKDRVESPGQEPHVLVVDDSSLFRSAYRSCLEAGGYVVFEANDGAEALTKMQKRKFDALVTDIKMPTMDGLELIASIRSAEETRKMPVIAISSLFSKEDQNRGRAAGADSYLEKSKREELLSTLNTIIEQYYKDAESSESGKEA